jgi:hypothetical protein
MLIRSAMNNSLRGVLIRNEGDELAEYLVELSIV